MYYVKPVYYDPLEPYAELDNGGIAYSVCRDFDHICRYKGLRQIVYNRNEPEERFIALETPNPVETHAKFKYYDVPTLEENRLDLIALKFFGSAQYSWIISYFNDIEDGFTIQPGQRLRILSNFTDLFNTGELLAPIPATALNLGTE